MTALPADIAKYTNDGVVIIAENAALKATHPDAVDESTDEKEMFFVNPAHAQIFLDECLALRSKPMGLHEGVEVDDNLGVGTKIPIAPVVPSFRFLDSEHGVDVVARTRGFIYEMGQDRCSVELME